jgi:hypothetical protein
VKRGTVAPLLPSLKKEKKNLFDSIFFSNRFHNPGNRSNSSGNQNTARKNYNRSQPPFNSREGTSMNNYPREQNDTVSVGKPWGKGRLTHDFSGPLASRNPNKETTASRSVFRTDSILLTRERTTEGFEHENNFQEVNQQNSSTRLFLWKKTIGSQVFEN